eukprot:COSAG02_NODE_5313_length_4446_cov_11.536922_6_plen_86_part_01
MNQPVNGSTLAAEFLKGGFDTAAAAAPASNASSVSGASLAADFLAAEAGPTATTKTKGAETGASLAAAFLSEQEKTGSTTTTNPKG